MVHVLWEVLLANIIGKHLLFQVVSIVNHYILTVVQCIYEKSGRINCMEFQALHSSFSSSLSIIVTTFALKTRSFCNPF